MASPRDAFRAFRNFQPSSTPSRDPVQHPLTMTLILSNQMTTINIVSSVAHASSSKRGKASFNLAAWSMVYPWVGDPSGQNCCVYYTTDLLRRCTHGYCTSCANVRHARVQSLCCCSMLSNQHKCPPECRLTPEDSALGIAPVR